MKASELIKKLEKLIAKEGDLHIFVEVAGLGGEAIYTTSISEDVSEVSPYDIGEFEEPTYETINEIFPNFPMKEDDSFYDVIEEYNGEDTCRYLTIFANELVQSD